MNEDIDNGLSVKEEEAQLWREFRSGTSSISMDDMVRKYAGVVRFVVGRIRNRLPDYVDYQDLFSYGMEGLFQAISRFDVDQNVLFSTYAIPRIKGAVIDGVRATDWIPRTLGTNLKLMQSAIDANPEISDDELAEYMFMDLDQLKKLQVYSVVAAPRYSLDSTLATEHWTLASDGGDDDGYGALSEKLADKRSGEIELSALETSMVVHDAIEALVGREREVFDLYYREGFSMREIGEIYGVTESRICQIRARVENKISQALHKKSRYEIDLEEWVMPEPSPQPV